MCGVLISARPAVLGAETVVHRYASNAPDPRFERLLYLAIGTEFLRMGVSSALEEGPDRNYVLIVEYSIKDGIAAVSFDLFPRGSPEKAARIERRNLRIDSSLDGEVAAAVKELVAEARIAFLPDPEAYIDGVLALPERIPIESAPTVSAAIEAEGAVGADETGVAAASIEGATEAVGAAETERPESVLEDPPPVTEEAELAGPIDRASDGGIEFDAGASALGLAFFGDLSQYVHYAAGAEAFGSASWPRSNWIFSAGLKAGIARAFNDPGIAGGPLLISTGLASARVEFLGAGGSASVFASVGAAILSILAESGAMSKTVPCAELGVSSFLPAGKGFGAGLGLGFRAFFDDPFIPAIIASVFVRWGS